MYYVEIWYKTSLARMAEYADEATAVNAATHAAEVLHLREIKPQSYWASETTSIEVVKGKEEEATA